VIISIVSLYTCKPENYTDTRKKHILSKGQTAIESRLSQNENAAVPIDCDIEKGLGIYTKAVCKKM